MIVLLFIVLASSSLAFGQNVALGPSEFAAPGKFPTSIYGDYYNNPTETSAQVQPIITDLVTVSTLFAK